MALKNRSCILEQEGIITFSHMSVVILLLCRELGSILLSVCYLIQYFVFLSEFRQTLALADAKRRDHQRKAGEKTTHLRNLQEIKIRASGACPGSALLCSER